MRTMSRVILAVGAMVVLAAGGASAQERLSRLTLEEAVSLATRENATLRAKQFEYQAVGSNEITAGLRPNPTASFLAEQFNSSDGQRQYTFSIGQPIELGDKRGRRLESARAATRVTGHELDDVKRQVTFQVKKSFNDALVAREAAALAGENLKTLDELERVQRFRAEKGDISELELLRIQVQRFAFERDAADARQALAVYAQALPARHLYVASTHQLLGEAGRRLGSFGIHDVLGFLAVEQWLFLFGDDCAQVEADPVAQLDRPFDGCPLGVRVAQPLNDGVNLLVFDLGFLGRHLQAVFVVAQLDFRRQADHCFQTQRIEFDRFHARTCVRFDFLLRDRLGNHLWHESIERLFDDALLADHALDHRARGFPAPEPGHVDSTGQATKRIVNGAVKTLLLDFDGQRNLARRQLGGGDLHSGAPSSDWRTFGQTSLLREF